MALNIRQVRLVEGRYDGAVPLASHSTVIMSGHVYVWDGGDDKDRFVDAMALMHRMPEADRLQEQDRIRALFKNTRAVNLRDQLQGIPEWRVNMWLELFRYGAVE